MYKNIHHINHYFRKMLIKKSRSHNVKSTSFFLAQTLESLTVPYCGDGDSKREMGDAFCQPFPLLDFNCRMTQYTT